MSSLLQNNLAIVISTHQAQFQAVAFKGDFTNNIIKITQWGYRGVELAIRDPRIVDIDLLESVLKQQGMNVPAIGTGQAWGEERLSFTDQDAEIRNAAKTRIKDHLQLARRLNAVIIIGLIRGTTPPGQSRQQSMTYLHDYLKECAEAGAEYGVRFAIEPLNRYETDLIHTVQEGLDFIDQLNAPNLGLLLDTFHMNIEEPVIAESIRQAGERIFHFHVADSNRHYPGAGHLDFSAILKALQSTGYQGWISGEFMPLPDAEIAAQRSIALIKNIL